MQFTLRELICAVIASGSLMGVCMLSYVHREAELIQIAQFEIKLKIREDENEKYVSALKKRMKPEDVVAAQKECGRYSDNVLIGYRSGGIGLTYLTGGTTNADNQTFTVNGKPYNPEEE